jgi:hypothetical protein
VASDNIPSQVVDVAEGDGHPAKRKEGDVSNLRHLPVDETPQTEITSSVIVNDVLETSSTQVITDLSNSEPLLNNADNNISHDSVVEVTVENTDNESIDFENLLNSEISNRLYKCKDHINKITTQQDMFKRFIIPYVQLRKDELFDTMYSELTETHIVYDAFKLSKIYMDYKNNLLGGPIGLSSKYIKSLNLTDNELVRINFLSIKSCQVKLNFI